MPTVHAGIGGPPMMIMYAWLRSSKDEVRATNAVMALVQDQWIGYYLLGLLHLSDIWLYVICGVTSIAGLMIGHSAQKLMDQRFFNAVMMVLMLVCACLMFAAAFGVINLLPQ